MARDVSDLRVLMLSLATDILSDSLGDGRERHADYAARIGHLHMLIYAPRSMGTRPVEVSPHLTLYPSGSRSRYAFPFDATRVGARLCRSERVNLVATQDPFTTGWAGVWLKRRCGLPLQVNNHSTFFENPHWLAERPARHRLFAWLGRRVVRRADTLRTVNAHQRNVYVKMGIDPRRIAVIPTPVHVERFLQSPDPVELDALRERLQIPSSGKVVLWVGRPAEQRTKRLVDLLEAFATVQSGHPDAVLVLVGEMRDATYVQRHVARLGMDAYVRRPGPVTHASLPAYYALCDVFVLSSVYEGMPKVVVEAAASGRPVVATRIPGVEEAIVEGETGLLCQPKSPADLADKLSTLLGDPATATAMGQRARAFAQEHFDRERAMQAITSLWAQAASGAGEH